MGVGGELATEPVEGLALRILEGDDEGALLDDGAEVGATLSFTEGADEVLVEGWNEGWKDGLLVMGVEGRTDGVVEADELLDALGLAVATTG